MRFLRSFVLPVVFVGQCLLAAPTFAQTGPYIGGSIAYVKSQRPTELKVDPSFELSAGYFFTEALAVELNYAPVSLSLYEQDSISLDATIVDVSGIYAQPIIEGLSAYAKIGLFFWDAEASSGTKSASADGNNYSLGVGFKAAVTDSLNLKSELAHFRDVDGVDFDFISIGMDYAL